MSEPAKIVVLSPDELAQIVRQAVAEAQGNKPQPSPKMLYDAKEAAEICGVPETWIGKAAREGRLPRVQLGHYVRFNPNNAWNVNFNNGNVNNDNKNNDKHVRAVRTGS